MNNLWFVKFSHKTESSQIVFLFTMGSWCDETDAFAHGRTFISAGYADQFKNTEATLICETPATVLCFEPC